MNASSDGESEHCLLSDCRVSASARAAAQASTQLLGVATSNPRYKGCIVCPDVSLGCGSWRAGNLDLVTGCDGGGGSGGLSTCAMDAYDILGARSLLIGAGRLAAPEPGVSCRLTCSVYQQGDWMAGATYSDCSLVAVQ